jgi:hypothetical protein
MVNLRSKFQENFEKARIKKICTPPPAAAARRPPPATIIAIPLSGFQPSG